MGCCLRTSKVRHIKGNINIVYMDCILNCKLYQLLCDAHTVLELHNTGFILDKNLMGQMAPSYKNQWVILKMYGSLDLTQHNI